MYKHCRSLVETSVAILAVADGFFWSSFLVSNPLQTLPIKSTETSDARLHWVGILVFGMGKTTCQAECQSVKACQSVDANQQ